MTAAPFTICGTPSWEKVAVLISTIGRSPARAAPTATPQYASSEMGGHTMREACLRVTGSMTWALGVCPVKRAPMSTTRGSSAQISSTASASASANFSVRVAAGARTSTDTGECLRLRQRALEREARGAVDLAAHLRVDRAKSGRVDRAVPEELRCVGDHRVALHRPGAHPVRRARRVEGPGDVGRAADKLGEGAVVPGPARGARLDEERPLADPHTLEETAHEREDGLDVGPVHGRRLDAEGARHVGWGGGRRGGGARKRPPRRPPR